MWGGAQGTSLLGAHGGQLKGGSTSGWWRGWEVREVRSPGETTGCGEERVGAVRGQERRGREGCSGGRVGGGAGVEGELAGGQDELQAPGEMACC